MSDNDRDALVPPDVTIRENITDDDNHEFQVVESGEVMATADSYEGALADARTLYGEDVEVATDAAPSTPQPVQEPDPFPPSSEPAQSPPPSNPAFPPPTFPPPAPPVTNP